MRTAPTPPATGCSRSRPRRTCVSRRRDRGGAEAVEQALEVARLIMQNAEHVTPALQPRALEERWILARLDAARTEVEEAWGRFDFATATSVLYHVTFDDFCDWYAEAVKPRLHGRDVDAVATALASLERLLALLHPVLPHVTEEIWSHLPNRASRLIVSPWPDADDRFAADLGALDRVQEAAAMFRRSGVQVELGSDDERRVFAAVVRPERRPATGDATAELERLRNEIERAEKMLANERFVQNAPADGSRGGAREACTLPSRARGARRRRQLSSGEAARSGRECPPASPHTRRRGAGAAALPDAAGRWRCRPQEAPGSSGSRRSVPGPSTASGSSACRCCWPTSAILNASTRRSTSSARTANRPRR